MFLSPGQTKTRRLACLILYLNSFNLWSDYLQEFCLKESLFCCYAIFFIFLPATEKSNFLSQIHNFYCKLPYMYGQLAQSIILLVFLFHLPVSRIQSPLHWRIFFFQLFYNLVDTCLYKNTAGKL